jgi:hypothetical protein
MKKKDMMMGLSMIAMALTMQSFVADDNVMTKEDGMYVINTPLWVVISKATTALHH